MQARHGPAFGCCDAQEVGIFLEFEGEPVSVRFDRSETAPKPLYELVQFVNRVGQVHFGRRFSLPLPQERIDPRAH